jgi:DNA-binding response OmpR family regulator
LGHNVVATAQSFEDAMSVFRQARPDLILMDISLAGKTDGIETAHALRDTRKIPIIFVSAASDEITVSRAMGEATDAYLLKPFTSRRLNDAINSALRGNLKVENKYWNSHRAGVNR